jgi:hypothetical protein
VVVVLDLIWMIFSINFSVEAEDHSEEDLEGGNNFILILDLEEDLLVEDLSEEDQILVDSSNNSEKKFRTYFKIQM